MDDSTLNENCFD